MAQSEVEKFKKLNGDIRIRGKNPPRPITDWAQCGLGEDLLKVLAETLCFGVPFPIQSQGLPVILSGRDMIGVAETGSGKTLAYLLPMLRHIKDQRPVAPGEGPISLILAPTVELAEQIRTAGKPFFKATGIRALSVCGGRRMQEQIGALKRGVEIIVATPGRLIDVLTLGKGRVTNLKRVTFVVVDEADRMFDMGFEPQLARILGNVRPDRQTVLFSATFPRTVENLARGVLNSLNAVEVIVGSRGKACSRIQQHVLVLE